MSVEILADRSDDKSLLLIAQLGINGQGERFSGSRFRDGEITRLVAQRLKARLQMQWDGIVDLRADLARCQVLAEGSRSGAGMRITY